MTATRAVLAAVAIMQVIVLTIAFADWWTR
jgi:hypothetical protein